MLKCGLLTQESAVWLIGAKCINMWSATNTLKHDENITHTSKWHEKRKLDHIWKHRTVTRLPSHAKKARTNPKFKNSWRTATLVVSARSFIRARVICHPSLRFSPKTAFFRFTFFKYCHFVWQTLLFDFNSCLTDFSIFDLDKVKILSSDSWL